MIIQIDIFFSFNFFFHYSLNWLQLSLICLLRQGFKYIILSLNSISGKTTFFLIIASSATKYPFEFKLQYRDINITGMQQTAHIAVN